MARPRLAVLAASLALFGGVGAAAFLPQSATGCSSAFASVLAAPAETTPTEPPVQNPDEVAADVAAVEAASSVVADASTRNSAARQGADEAEQSAPSGGYGTIGVTYARVSAQQAADQAQAALDEAEATLAMDLANRNAYPVGDPSYVVHDDLVAEDRILLESLRNDLADAKSVLESATAAQSSVDAATAVLDQTTAELAAAQTALDAARAAQLEHQAAFAPVYAAWQASEQAAAAAADAERVRCQEGGRSRLIVAGVIAIVGGALGSYALMQRR